MDSLYEIPSEKCWFWISLPLHDCSKYSGIGLRNSQILCPSLRWGNIRRYFQFGPILKNKPNHWASTFQPKVENWGTVIYFLLLRMGPNRKYLLKLPHHLYDDCLFCILMTFLQLSHIRKAYSVKNCPIFVGSISKNAF